MRLGTGLSISIVLIMFTLQSCDLLHPAAQIPSYIQVTGFDLVTNAATQGSNSHKITDVWLYVDKNLVGVFELPATIPVLKAGKHSIQLYPGIKVNGIAASRSAYDFYTSLDTSVTLTPDKTISLRPTVNYSSIAKFTWLENFDAQGISLYKSASSDTGMSLAPLSFDGSLCGAVYMDAARPYAEVLSSYAFNLPKQGKLVYLEFNYKTSSGFTVGVLSTDFSGGTQKEDVLVVQSSNGEWKKMYVKLTDVISNNSLAVTNSIYFYSAKSSAEEKSDFYLDNLKLINE